MMNDTIIFDEPSDFVIYPYVRYIIVVMVTLILITSSAALVVLWLYLRTASSPTALYIRLIVILSFLGVFFGQSMTLVGYASDFHIYSYRVCKGFRLATLSIHFGSNVTNIFLLTGMSIHRYRTITASTVNTTKRKPFAFVLLLLWWGLVFTITLFTLLYLRYEVTYSRNECGLAFGRVTAKCPEMFAQCSGFMLFIVLSIALGGCSLILGVTTYKLRQKVTDNDRKLSSFLGKYRITDTSRIKATHYLWFVFTIEWLPYGLAQMLINANISLSTFYSIGGMFHTISTLSFLSVPIVYYKMDRQFNKYILNKFHKISRKVTGKKKHQNPVATSYERKQTIVTLSYDQCSC